MKNYLLEIVVFITGAVVMILELVGIRILAPYVGSSLIVWTSLIGIILGSLSLGYAKGGQLADKRPSYRIFSLIIFASAVNIALVSVFREYVLTIVASLSHDLRVTSVISATILFAPPSVLLGMVVPYTVRLKLKSLDKTGRTAGNLFAASTVGSIVGTFTAGFYLIAILGSGKILILLSALLLVASYLALKGQPSTNRDRNLFLFFSIVVIGLFGLQPTPPWFFDVDTTYSRVILEKTEKDERPILTMRTGIFGIQSAMFLDKDDELVLEYTKYYRLVEHFVPHLNQVLMIGGGGYSYPKDFLKNFPNASMDVIEIDPEVTELARDYFNLVNDPRLTIDHADGRVYLNTNEKKYDAILIDAYGSDIAIPFQLTTYEAVGRIYGALNEDGVVIANIISAIEGPAGKLLQAEVATYKEVFPQVYLFPVYDPKDAYRLQNIALVALKSTEKPNFESENTELTGYLSHLWIKEVPNDMPILTDDYAPVDQYMLDLIRKRN